MRLFGDNGIISNAQNASIKNGMAILEEWLQEEYVKYYDEANEYMNKTELLADKINNLFLKDGSKNYIVYNGKIYYLINKSVLPKEIKDSLSGGNSTNYVDYIRLIDVYGVTSDLKVYYCSEGNETIFGNSENLEIDPNSKLAKINANSSMKNAVTNALNQQGISVNEDGDIRYGDISSIKELTLDGTTYTATNLSGISELRNLKKLVLTNCTLSNLDGIQSCIYLNYFYNKYSNITDYSNLSQCVELEYLYMYNVDNTNIKNLSNGLSSSNLIKLSYFGIFGHEICIDGYVGTTEKLYNTSSRSNVTDISSLSIISEETRNSIKTLYLNNNKLESIEVLEFFPNLVLIEMRNNSTLTSLHGLENHNKLVTLYANYSGLTDISALENCSSLINIFVNNNLKLEKIYISNATTSLYSENCNLRDIECLKGEKDEKNDTYLGISSLNHLSLSNNNNLVNVEEIKYCKGIRKLYLENNINMLVNDVKQLENTIIRCGNNYSIPAKYLKYFTTTKSFDYGGYVLEDGSGLTDYTEEISALKDSVHINSLSLRACKLLGNSRVIELLHNGTFKVSDISKMLTNLTLTDSEKTYLISLKNYTDIQFQEMTQEQMESLEPSKNDISLRYILSTMTGLQVLSIWDVTNLTSIDFMNQLTNMKILDLRGTNIVNLNILETMTKNKTLSLSTICLSNQNIELSLIQSVINSLDGAWAISNRMNLCSMIQATSGLIITNDALSSKLAECNNLTQLVINNPEYRGFAQIDLTNTKLEKISTYGTSLQFKYPSTCYSVNRRWTRGHFDDFSNCISKPIRICYRDSAFVNEEKEEYTRFCKSLSTMIGTIEELKIQMTKNTYDFSEFINNFSPVVINKIEIYGNLTSTFINMNGFSKYATKELKTLYIDYGKIADLSWISGITSLTSLTITNNSIADISEIETLTNLSYLKLNNNFIKDLSPLKNIASLVELSVTNNMLENYCVYYKNGEKIEVYNINILYDMYNLNKNNGEITGPLRRLDLTNNPISDDSKIRNLNWIKYTDYAGVVVK